jgi:glutaredoxin
MLTPPGSARGELRTRPLPLNAAVARSSFAEDSPLVLLILYSKPDCHLCVEARDTLTRVAADLPFELRELDITTDDALHRAYFERIPVVTLDGEELFEYFVQEHVLRERLATIL